jgi:hypothetical protein
MLFILENRKLLSLILIDLLIIDLVCRTYSYSPGKISLTSSEFFKYYDILNIMTNLLKKKKLI